MTMLWSLVWPGYPRVVGERALWTTTYPLACDDHTLYDPTMLQQGSRSRWEPGI